MEKATAGKTLYILRWVAFLPGAALGAWLAWLLFAVLGRMSLFYAGIEPDSFFSMLCYNTVGHAAVGAAFVYIGARISPAYQRVVAYVIGGVGLFFDGFFLFPAILMGNGWAIWGSVCVMFGIGAAVNSIHSDELDI